MEFKKVEIKDWELLLSLEKVSATKLFAPLDGEDGYKKYIKESVVYFIMDGDEAIGTISYKIQDDGKYYIDGLTIKPEFRKQGIAKRAMKKLLDEISDKDLVLLVHPENNAALLIYLHLGFAITK
ncbi:MAG: GNAT family N-acetyltransferase [Candidatus Pacebacteria bacterium]|nr:GNAT family N-acetyltransferase [Candidatus Paceibacterota bacterium]